MSGETAFSYYAPRLWNSLPSCIRYASSDDILKINSRPSHSGILLMQHVVNSFLLLLFLCLFIGTFINLFILLVFFLLCFVAIL